MVKRIVLVACLMAFGVILKANAADDAVLTLMVQPAKQAFFTDEKVVFDLVLKNEGKRDVLVRRLDEHSTFCRFNRSVWGVREPDGKDRILLEAGGKLRKKMLIGPLSKPGTLEIDCSYGMTATGVRPSDRKVVEIISKGGS